MKTKNKQESVTGTHCNNDQLSVSNDDVKDLKVDFGNETKFYICSCLCNTVFVCCKANCTDLLPLFKYHAYVNI